MISGHIFSWNAESLMSVIGLNLLLTFDSDLWPAHLLSLNNTHHMSCLFWFEHILLSCRIIRMQ